MLGWRFLLYSILDRFSGWLTIQAMTLLLACGLFWCLPSAARALPTSHALGDAAEGLMQDYFQAGGWQSRQGQVGRQGIDGLFVKVENGVVKDVMVVESKYGKSRLGGNLVCGGQQMSQSWLNCKLDDLIRSAKKNGASAEQIHEYEQIKKHVAGNNYRGRLWNAKVENGRLSVDLRDVKGKGEAVDLGRLSGGSRYKIQSPQNTTIDLKNPKDAFQRRVAESYFTNLDKTLQRNGVPDGERTRMMREFRNDPSRITQGLQQYASRTPPRATAKTAGRQPVKTSFASMKHSPATKRVAKGFFKSLGRNLKTGVAGATSFSWGGPVAMAAGFVGGIAVGMAADYLMDTAVDTAFAAVAPDEQSAEGPPMDIEGMRQTVEETARQTQERINQVEDRMVREFAILGEDIQYKHEAQMAAIGLNLAEIVKTQEISLRVEDKVDALHADLHSLGADILGNMQAFGLQLEGMAQSLDSISMRIDQILERLDASIKADLDNGVEAMDLYDQTGDEQHLQRALEYFTNFINTIEGIDNRSAEDDELLLLARFYKAATCADLYMHTTTGGYARKAVETFTELSEHSANLDFLVMAYLSILDADTENRAAAIIQARAEEAVVYLLATGSMDQARGQALYLESVLGTDQSRQFREAVTAFVDTGRDSDGGLGIEDDDYHLLMSLVHTTQPDPDVRPGMDAVRNLLAGRPTPVDYDLILGRYQNGDLVKFAVRQLIDGQYFHDALNLLNQYAPQDDTFRIRAYLLLLNKTSDKDRYRQLRDLVLTDPTYAPEAKDYVRIIERFVRKIQADSGTTPP